MTDGPRWLAACVPLILASLSCSPDPAEPEYLEALRGEESGMSRQEQLARLGRAKDARCAPRGAAHSRASKKRYHPGPTGRYAALKYPLPTAWSSVSREAAKGSTSRVE